MATSSSPSAGTVFASLDKHTPGGVEIIGQESARHYAFSNMFEIASNTAPWERVVAAQNLEFVIEVVRAEGESPWYICAHDETALVMEGSVETRFIEPADSALAPPAGTEGACRLGAQPPGAAMGYVRASRGHMILLPAGAAYRFAASGRGVLLIQTIKGEVSVEKWAEICQH